MVTDIQKTTAQAIVNIFETGSIHGNYGNVTLLKGDAGHLTYGRSQTTLASGNLYLLVKAYCEAPSAVFSSELSPYLSRLANRDLALDNDLALRNLLVSAGLDPIMHDVQDQFFDRVYWNPAVQSAGGLGLVTALSTGVVYDSCVHGSWRAIRDLTIAQFGQVNVIGEQAWVKNYVETRKSWLANNANTLLRSTVYRMEAFEQLITAASWDLNLPIRVRGLIIDQASLEDRTPVSVSAHDDAERMLSLKDPFMRGKDVEAVQIALKSAGFTLDTDGVFGQGTDAAVKSFQQSKGLKPDGIVGPATRSALGL